MISKVDLNFLSGGGFSEYYNELRRNLETLVHWVSRVTPSSPPNRRFIWSGSPTASYINFPSSLEFAFRDWGRNQPRRFVISNYQFANCEPCQIELWLLPTVI